MVALQAASPEGLQPSLQGALRELFRLSCLSKISLRLNKSSHSLILDWATVLQKLLKMTQRFPQMIDPNVNEDIIFSGSFKNRNALDAGFGEY